MERERIKRIARKAVSATTAGIVLGGAIGGGIHLVDSADLVDDVEDGISQVVGSESSDLIEQAVPAAAVESARPAPTQDAMFEEFTTDNESRTIDIANLGCRQ